MIYLPYTRIQDATWIALNGYDPIPVDCSGQWGYVQFFEDRWAQGDTFISCEHDVVPWPGAIEALRDCPKPLCYHSDQWRTDITSPTFCRFGLVKISGELISATPDVWTVARQWMADRADPWNALDTHLSDCLRHHTTITSHEHFPGTINANPVYYAAQLKGKPMTQPTPQFVLGLTAVADGEVTKADQAIENEEKE